MSDPILTGLDTQPRHAYSFLWADYVELLALCSSDGVFSRSGLQEIAQEGGDLQSEDMIEDVDPDSTPAEVDDAISKRWDEIRTRFEIRQHSFPGWPFRLEGHRLIRAFVPENDEHRLYIALLIASSLRLCPKTREGEVAASLEEITYHLFSKMMPQGWQVRPFGAHQTIGIGYSGTLLGKLQQLERDINGKLMKDPADYDPRDTGDGGIDVVAWDDLGDHRGHIPVIFAQCGCSPQDWEKKQLEVSTSAIEAHIVPQHPGAAYYITPHDLSASDIRWERASKITRVIVLDRLRLLRLAVRHAVFPQLPAMAHVDEVVGMNYQLNG